MWGTVLSADSLNAPPAPEVRGVVFLSPIRKERGRDVKEPTKVTQLINGRAGILGSIVPEPLQSTVTQYCVLRGSEVGGALLGWGSSCTLSGWGT